MRVLMPFILACLGLLGILLLTAFAMKSEFAWLVLIPVTIGTGWIMEQLLES